mmetsp:Transcript_22590/g.35239  ORF Transcript_22590/g.35239 Transcript_22590/m.35239 type:complete len:229 (+) Transcript_22590:82-768(+)
MVQLRNAEYGESSTSGCIAIQGIHARMKDIEQKTVVLIEYTLAGNAPRLWEIMTQISPKEKVELGLIANIIVSKALDEPQHCQACVSLSSVLREYLPACPSSHRRENESFMHALLDVLQTEFEKIFTAASSSYRKKNKMAPPWDRERLRSIVQFAGHLHCNGLLGKKVVAQMVEDLVNVGEDQCANELLWAVGVVPQTKTSDDDILAPIAEDSYESEDASSGGWHSSK